MAEKRKDNKGRNLKDGEDQLPDGRYRFRYCDIKGNRHAVYSWCLVPTDKIPTGKRFTLSLREKEDAIQRDTMDGINARAASEITLNDMFKLYMSGKTELKQSTRTNYNYMYNNYVLGNFGARKISNIKYSDVKRFYNMLIHEKNFKPNSMEVINTILHPVFTLAVRDGYIRTNPTAGVMQEIKKGHKWEKSKRHALTIEEQEAFINYVAKSEMYSHWLPIFTVFLGTGCRVGEVIGLRWKDCNFENKTISINHNLIYRQQDNGKCEMHITTPKTNSGCRIVPMLNEVKNALLSEKKRQMKEGNNKVEIDGYSGFVFTNRFGSVHNPQALNRALERIRKAANEDESITAELENRKAVVIPHFSVHNLRHTFCTRFCENETNIKVIQEIMGHSDISTTMNVYAEATDSKKKECFNSLEGKIKIS